MFFMVSFIGCATYYNGVAKTAQKDKVIVVGGIHTGWGPLGRVWEINLKTGEKKELEVEYK